MLLLKNMILLIFITCLSLVNSVYIIPFLPSVLGFATTERIMDYHKRNYFATTFQSGNNIHRYQRMSSHPESCGNQVNNNLKGIAGDNCSLQSSSVGVPATDFNKSKTLRIAVIGDVDSNQGLTTQLEIANRYNVQALILTGDFEYSNGNKVLSDLQSHGFTKENTDIVVGNHDSEQDVKAWLNEKEPFGQVNFAFATDKLALFNIDANTRFDCSSPQFGVLKSQIGLSKALYKFIVIHQPFVTVKSTHPDNGQFNCYDPMFRAAGIDEVLQAHNHNYQRFNINGLMYGVFGTGTHDTGSSMYPLNSNDWNGNNCLKCITGKNGITILDLHFNDKSPKHFVGWFIGMNREILDSFESFF